MVKSSKAYINAKNFAQDLNLRVPIILSPMAGVCPPSLSIAVANAGGMGSCGALLMKSEEILEWVKEIRENSNGAFQLNTWIPDPEPTRDIDNEKKIKALYILTAVLSFFILIIYFFGNNLFEFKSNFENS